MRNALYIFGKAYVNDEFGKPDTSASFKVCELLGLPPLTHECPGTLIYYAQAVDRFKGPQSRSVYEAALQVPAMRDTAQLMGFFHCFTVAIIAWLKN